MTPEQQAAYVMAQAASLNAKVAGMVAENQIREQRGFSLAYDETAFQEAIDESGCHHNSVIGLYNAID